MNIILISLDTLTAGHLGCYGYWRNTSPNIDKFAESATIFENCFAPGIPTQPCYTTTFSGREPLDHGIVAHGGVFDVRSDVVFLPELLADAGYHTACVSSLPRMKPWFKRGWKEDIPPSKIGRYIQMVTAESINNAAVPWLRSRKPDGRFFLFLHYWDVHTPYLAPIEYRNRFYTGNPGDPNLTSFLAFEKDPFAEWWLRAKDEQGSLTGWIARLAKDAGVERITDAEYIVAQYDAELAYLDDHMVEIFDVLKETGLEEDTFVMFMADHGEEMYEHGIFFDHHGLYDPNIYTPLFARLPGQTGGRHVSHHVRHQDIAVTLLELAGAKTPDEMVGMSLVPFLRGETPDEWRDDSLLTEENSWMSKWALRKNGFKLIKARAKDWHNFPPRELYHIPSDPGETHNLVEAESKLADEMDEELEARVSEGLKRYGRAVDPIVEQGLSPMGQRAWNWIKKSKYW
jgi:arylsulfatase A-like enzyme